jgi:hypothetical protein
MSCRLTEGLEGDGQSRPRRFRIVDKHGLSHFVYNLQIEIDLDGSKLSLGLGAEQLPARSSAARSGEENAARPSATAPNTEESIEELATILKKNRVKMIIED